jgi:UDPglucose 6-dehydrogenase
MDRVLEMIGYQDSEANSDDSIVGIYRLSMKVDSDNFRESSICSIMELLKEKGRWP